VRNLARAVAKTVDIGAHSGVHPRFGALDVVPFVALGGTAAERKLAAGAARSFARWWASEAEVPVFCYDGGGAGNHDLPYVRRHAFGLHPPDFGPPAPHPRLGATAVGARGPLIAVNCLLATGEVDVARRLARRVRESDGGLRGVRALGLFLESRARSQVSMNLVDPGSTGLEDAVTAVRDLARREGTDIAAVELVGLLPARELERCSGGFLAWTGLGAAPTIESRLAR
jgi:glutamate formiminotransferase